MNVCLNYCLLTEIISSLYYSLKSIIQVQLFHLGFSQVLFSSHFYFPSKAFHVVGDEVAKFCAKYLHQQFLRHEAYSAGELSTSIQKSFLRLFCFFNSLSSFNFFAGTTLLSQPKLVKATGRCHFPVSYSFSSAKDSVPDSTFILATWQYGFKLQG